MNKEELIRIFDHEQRIELQTSGSRREMDGSVIRHVSVSNEQGYVIYSKLNEHEADDAIRRQLHYFNGLGQRFEWKLYDWDQPADLKTRLEAHGFEVGDPEALMVMTLHEDHPIRSIQPTEGIREIRDAAGIDDIIALENKIWNEPHEGLGERLKRDLENDPEHLHLYAAYEDGQAVCAAWMYLHEGTSFASLWGGSTLPDYRRKGYYTSIISLRAKVAWQKGYRFLTVDASPMSRPILEQKGFECLGYSYPCLSPIQPK